MGTFERTGESVSNLLDTLPSQRKIKDAQTLIQLCEVISDHRPEVWYPGIIGFGCYTYEDPRGQTHSAPLLAFAPRKQRISIYLGTQFPNREILLFQLGKHQAGVGCVYINKLDDIDLDILRQLLIASLEFSRTQSDYPSA